VHCGHVFLEISERTDRTNTLLATLRTHPGVGEGWEVKVGQLIAYVDKRMGNWVAGKNV